MPSNDYGPHARTALQVATGRGWCTQDSFSAYLSAALRQGTVSRALVAGWETGREHIPGDVATVHLARHTGHEQEVLQVYADPLDLLVVPRPRGAVSGRDVVVLAATAVGAAGRLVEHIVSEADARSDGGHVRTQAELVARIRLIDAAARELAALRAETLAALHGVPVAFPPVGARVAQ